MSGRGGICRQHATLYVTQTVHFFLLVSTETHSQNFESKIQIVYCRLVNQARSSYSLFLQETVTKVKNLSYCAMICI